MNIQLISAIIVVAILLLIYLLIKLNKNIRLKAYKYFLLAEHEFVKSGEGEDKMNYVIDNVYSYLPTIVKLFISPGSLKKIVQKMFDEIKDFLDDGKINKSTKGEE